MRRFHPHEFSAPAPSAAEPEPAPSELVRLVRLHLQAVTPSGDSDGTMTIEGMLRGRQDGAARLLIERPRVLNPDGTYNSIGGKELPPDGGYLEIPASRLIFVEVLAIDARSPE